MRKTHLRTLAGFAMLMLAPGAFAQAKVEGTARAMVDPAVELRAMTIVPICNPRSPIESDGQRLKCGDLPSQNTCPAGQVAVGMEGNTVECQTVSYVPPTRTPLPPRVCSEWQYHSSTIDQGYGPQLSPDYGFMVSCIGADSAQWVGRGPYTYGSIPNRRYRSVSSFMGPQGSSQSGPNSWGGATVYHGFCYSRTCNR